MTFLQNDTIQKEGCKWIFVSHEKSSAGDIVKNLKDLEGDISFKYEAFVLHAQCRTLDDAQQLVRFKPHNLS